MPRVSVAGNAEPDCTPKASLALGSQLARDGLEDRVLRRSWGENGQRQGGRGPSQGTIQSPRKLDVSQSHPPFVSPPCPLFPPQVFHEQGILFGYRHPQSSATACILSLFQMTNETLNIWTHLLPFWYLRPPGQPISFGIPGD